MCFWRAPHYRVRFTTVYTTVVDAVQYRLLVRGSSREFSPESAHDVIMTATGQECHMPDESIYIAIFFEIVQPAAASADSLTQGSLARVRG